MTPRFHISREPYADRIVIYFKMDDASGGTPMIAMPVQFFIKRPQNGEPAERTSQCWTLTTAEEKRHSKA